MQKQTKNVDMKNEDFKMQFSYRLVAIYFSLQTCREKSETERESDYSNG
jgi:hypothetical protein